MYPYFLLETGVQIYPIFGSEKFVAQYIPIADFSNMFLNIPTRDFQDPNKFFQKLQDLLPVQGKKLILSGYLENRSHFLPDTMSDTTYHLGVDITVEPHTEVFAPLRGKVYEVGFDAQDGGYGGYIILEHKLRNFMFYSVYGHLSYNAMYVQIGENLEGGEKIGSVGNVTENGGTFPHLHFQVVTKYGKEQGYLLKRYTDASTLTSIESLCPNPLFLLRYNTL